MIDRLPSPTDGRQQLVKLTGDGEDAYAVLDEGSREEVGALLDALPDPEAAIAAMRRSCERAIEPEPTR